MSNAYGVGAACSFCGVQLTGELDTFGQQGFPICWECYCESNAQDLSHYGLAPHVHDLTRTGSVIGSTVFTDEQNERFIEDEDAPGLGVWSLPGAKGWQ